MGAKANIVIDQGADFSTTVTVTDSVGDPLDLTGYSARGQIRKHYTSSTKVDFSTSFLPPRSSGILTLSLSSVQTANMESGRYVYDVELVSSANNVSRLVEGIATVTPEVTR
jgi:hypothetical protein